MRILIILFCLFICMPGVNAQTLKSGDNLSISVLQDPKLDRNVVVDPSGEIAFPLAGHIRARGLTPQALENILKAKLKGNYKDENLDVTIAVANSPKDIPEDDLKPKIFITGEVVRPGSYVVRQPTTLMQAIALAGGIGPFAAKQHIQVRRRGAGGPSHDCAAGTLCGRRPGDDRAGVPECGRGRRQSGWPGRGGRRRRDG